MFCFSNMKNVKGSMWYVRSMWISVVIVVETETEGFKHGREVNTSKFYARWIYACFVSSLFTVKNLTEPNWTRLTCDLTPQKTTHNPTFCFCCYSYNIQRKWLHNKRKIFIKNIKKNVGKRQWKVRMFAFVSC